MDAVVVTVAVGAGAFWWFLFEYVLHRWAFHEMRGKGLGSREHLNHHVRASWHFDHLMFLAWVGILLTGAGWAAVVWWWGGPTWGAAFGVGWALGYFFYEYHHAMAHLRAPRNRWEQWLRKHHFHHHFGHPLSNQGVTTSLWDHVFGTYEAPEQVRVPRRLAMPWLIDEHGAVRPEYAADYVLVGDAAATDERQAALDRARAFANLVPTP